MRSVLAIMLVGLALAGMLVLLSATPPPGSGGEAVATEDGAARALSEVKEVGVTSSPGVGVVNEQAEGGSALQLSVALIGPAPEDVVEEEDGNVLTEVVPMGITRGFDFADSRTAASPGNWRVSVIPGNNSAARALAAVDDDGFDVMQDFILCEETHAEVNPLGIVPGFDIGSWTRFVVAEAGLTEVVPLGIAEMFTGATFDAASDDNLDTYALIIITVDDGCDAYPVPYLAGFIGDENVPTEVNPLGIAEGDLQRSQIRPPELWIWLDPPDLSLFMWLDPPSVVIYV